MYRTQIQLTTEQAQALKQLAAREGKSVSELIRMSVEIMLRSGGVRDPRGQKQRAIEAAGKLCGDPQDLSKEHDRYLTKAFES